MIPTLSSIPAPSDFIAPHDIVKPAKEDWSLGGDNFLDANNGLASKIWHFKWSNSLAGVTAETPSNPPVEVYHRGTTDISWISGTFDQNMRQVIAYTKTDGTSSIYFYDAQQAAFTSLGIGTVATPFVSLDDTRLPTGGLNDVILTYIKSGDLCIRAQRERFADEHILMSGLPPAAKIKRFGMSRNLRLRWELLS